MGSEGGPSCWGEAGFLLCFTPAPLPLACSRGSRRQGFLFSAKDKSGPQAGGTERKPRAWADGEALCGFFKPI